MMQNVIITGIPRSGTTLLTAIVDNMQDSVALNEPAWHYRWATPPEGALGGEDFARWVLGDFITLRHKLLNGIPIPEKRKKDGTASTNYFRAEKEDAPTDNSVETISFTRNDLSENFTLAIKHPGLYLSILDQLVALKGTTIIAIIRDPVGVIASWNSVPIPVKSGELLGSGYWPAMHALTKQPMDIIEKQVRIYDLICKRLHRFKNNIHVVRYEDLIADTSIIEKILGKPSQFPVSKIAKRSSDFYGADLDKIRSTLKRFGQHYHHFYDTPI